MVKLILVLLALFGAFTLACVLSPTVWHTAFTVAGQNVPYIAVGLLTIGYISWKKIGH